MAEYFKKDEIIEEFEKKLVYRKITWTQYLFSKKGIILLALLFINIYLQYKYYLFINVIFIGLFFYFYRESRISFTERYIYIEDNDHQLILISYLNKLKKQLYLVLLLAIVPLFQNNIYASSMSNAIDTGTNINDSTNKSQNEDINTFIKIIQSSVVYSIYSMKEKKYMDSYIENRNIVNSYLNVESKSLINTNLNNSKIHYQGKNSND